MTAYTDATAIAAYLGRALSVAETAEAPAAIAAATAHVDRTVGRSWQNATVTGELQRFMASPVVLSKRPVTAITSITVRFGVPGETPELLTAGVDYELVDPTRGLVLVENVAPGRVLTISYTLAVVVPDDIKLATTMIATSWLSSVDPERLGIKKYSIAGELSVEYDDAEIPSGANVILSRFGRGVAFA
jgi:hypothetical protein